MCNGILFASKYGIIAYFMTVLFFSTLQNFSKSITHLLKSYSSVSVLVKFAFDVYQKRDRIMATYNAPSRECNLYCHVIGV